MELKDLAPWIAIAITLALSILVPLFTQIANNRHQRKLQQEQFEREQKQKKIIVYEEFLKNVGAVIARPTPETFIEAGAYINQIYIYAPTEWHDDLDELFVSIRTCKWETATSFLQKISRLISEELKK